MADELGVTLSNGNLAVAGNGTYKPVSESLHNILHRHKVLSNFYGLSVSEADSVLPRLFGIPKLHKNPYKFRFIAGASKSSLRPLSCLLAKVLTFLKSHFVNYCNVIKRNTGLSVYWSINSSLSALRSVAKVNNASSIIAADFSTLYPSLPHNIIKESLFYLVNMLFKHASKEYILIGFNNCFYSDQPKANFSQLRKHEVFEIINFVLDNTLVTFAGLIFRQVCGIPMGGNASPLLADLTLSVLEFKFLNNPAYVNEKRILQYTTHYIDDLFSLNVPGFLSLCARIYSMHLPLTQTNFNVSSANYLDFMATCSTSGIETELYDKTADFNFSVIKFTAANSNVHSKILYGTFFSQLVRITRICNNSRSFRKCVIQLYNTFLSKGFDRKLLKKKFKHFTHTYMPLILRVGLYNPESANRFIRDFL
ncbi:MAG: hypothetical protein GY861_26875 [bacterium]|nr:hypothetical protein [bacterium]